ncbi:hypothetical protein BGZ89_009045 [Linnemannia elongata]|nr:hypothetical protein BGZ89_009045 [Linnemannia elongata]
MDGIEAGPSSKCNNSSVSAVPETPFGDYGGVAGLDGGSNHKLMSVVDDRSASPARAIIATLGAAPPAQLEM